MTLTSGTKTLRPDIRPPSLAEPEAVRRHLDALTKPRGSLGRLEDLALRLALIYGDPPPKLARRVVYLLAADHGVARRGVSAYPPEVTAQMCRNYVAGGAAVCAIARTVEAEVVTVDIGVDADLGGLTGIVHRKVRRGTRDLSLGPALTPDEVHQAIAVGRSLVVERSPVPDVIALGEMGIANTTAASAITAALLQVPAAQVVGSGTGIGAPALAIKCEIVAHAVARLGRAPDPLRVLVEVGGLEIAGLVGVVLGAAELGRAVVTDGLITTAAALTAVRWCPAAREYLFASHRSVEPGHRMQLAALHLDPLFDLSLRLGEGTGAALALPLLDAAGAILREMATFQSAGVATAVPGGGT